MGAKNIWLAYTRSGGTLADTFTAFFNSDLMLAKEVEHRDDQVADAFPRLKGELVNLIKSEKYNLDDLLDILMIGKYLERMADHCTNVWKWVEFFHTGRHQETQIF